MAEAAERLDAGRLLALAISILAAFIVVLDNTVLNVSIPTILRDLHTTLPTLEWVITGYALTFATLLIIGGRLGDVYGHRRIFIIGLALFGIGSLLASISTSVGELILGEAIIEGIGASLMLPATLAILSGTFRGRLRAAAFAAWGATAGVAAAAGPVVGGFLTTNYSWRWSFRINVIVAPIAILGAWLFMRPSRRAEHRPRVDIPGAIMIAIGMFLLVFSLSEGAIYGWWQPLKDFDVAGRRIWPATRAVSFIPLLFVVSVLVLVAFVVFELGKEANRRDPLFEFAHLRFKSYRYGLLTGLVLAMGQLGLSFVLPVFLQDAKHLTAARNGLWLLPSGIFVIIGAQLAGFLIRRFGTTRIVRTGLVLYTVGLLLILHVISLDITALALLPGLALYGAGIGFAAAQLTNVVLAEIPPESSGVASGANTTVRQVGSALGVSIIGSLLTVQTVRAATDNVLSAKLPPAVKARTIAGIHALGSAYVPPGRLSTHDEAVVRGAIEHGVTSGTRVALLFAAIVIGLGAIVSLLIPNDMPPPDDRSATLDEPVLAPELLAGEADIALLGGDA
jgi:EmrB/QacA subfamily drug resistance transporter